MRILFDRQLNREYYKNDYATNILEYIFVYHAYHRIVKSELAEVGSLGTVVNNNALHPLRNCETLNNFHCEQHRILIALHRDSIFI